MPHDPLNRVCDDRIADLEHANQELRRVLADLVMKFNELIKTVNELCQNR